MSVNRQGSAAALATFNRWYSAHEGRDIACLSKVLASAAEIHSLFRNQPVRGRSAAVNHFRAVNETFEDLAMMLQCVPAVGDDRVLVEVEFSGRFAGVLKWRGVAHSGSGQHFCVPGVAVVHTAGAEVSRVRTLFDRDEWLRQIGIDPYATPRQTGPTGLTHRSFE